MTDQETAMRLGRIAYKASAMYAAIDGARKRIIDEWIDKTPLKTYGNPPKVLSKPLTRVQVAGMLDCYGDNLTRYAESLRAIAKELGDD